MKRELGANPEQSRCCVPFDCTSNLLPLTDVGKADVWGKSEDLQNQLNHVYSRKVCVGTNLFYFLRICFEIISSSAERCFWVDLCCQGAANSGLFARLESAKMSKRASDKPKSRLNTYKR